LDDLGFADLVALCQSLPGPASSQVIFGVGLALRGWLGGLACWLGFTLPSVAIMIAAGYGANALGGIFQAGQAGWLAGLKIAAVAVVANAVWSMGATLCPDRSRQTLAVLAAFTMLWK